MLSTVHAIMHRYGGIVEGNGEQQRPAVKRDVKRRPGETTSGDFMWTPLSLPGR